MKLTVSIEEAKNIIKKVMGVDIVEIEGIDLPIPELPISLRNAIPQIVGYIRGNHKLDAIKILRGLWEFENVKRMGLKEAKDIIDEWARTSCEPNWQQIFHLHGYPND